jgi:hypothetical protein
MIKLCLCLLLVSSTFSVALAAKKPIGKIESVKGDAQIAHLLKKKKAATVGEEVFETDKIKTGADGEVIIALADSKLTIGPNSYTKISSQSQNASSSTKLSLYGGKVGFEVNKLSAEKSFTVRTPSAVAGVRGTLGEMSFDGDSGVTGTMSHTHGNDPNADPSIVYSTTPEHEKAMNDAIRESRENEANGLPDQPPGDGPVNILPENFVSVHLPDGESLRLENENGSELKEFAGKAAADFKAGQMTDAMRNKRAEDLAILAELFEERLEALGQGEGNRALPSPPNVPQD